MGDLVADHYIYGQTDRVSREAPVLIVRHESSEVKLGGGANVAANVRALGAGDGGGRPRRGRDGQALRKLFDERGHPAGGGRRGLQTETKTRILAGGMNTTRQQMLRLDRGSGALARGLGAPAAGGGGGGEGRGRGGGLGLRRRGGGRRDARRVAKARGGRPAGLRGQPLRLLTSPGFRCAKPNEPELEALTGLPVEDDRAVTRRWPR